MTPDPVLKLSLDPARQSQFPSLCQVAGRMKPAQGYAVVSCKRTPAVLDDEVSVPVATSTDVSIRTIGNLKALS